MKIIPRALSAGLALAAVPAQAFVTYQDIVSAATNPDDLSRQALVTIFGDVVTNPLTASSNTIIGNLFMVFNAIIATMGIVWFLFIGIRHAVRTGHQGSVFNNGRDVVGILSVVRRLAAGDMFYFRLESGATGHAVGRIHHGHRFRQYHGSDSGRKHC